MNQLDVRGWKRLISAISNKEVVPIIGKELFKVNGEPLQTYINKQVRKNLFVEYPDGMTFDQIVDVMNGAERLYESIQPENYIITRRMKAFANLAYRSIGFRLAIQSTQYGL